MSNFYLGNDQMTGDYLKWDIPKKSDIASSTPRGGTVQHPKGSVDLTTPLFKMGLP